MQLALLSGNLQQSSYSIQLLLDRARVPFRRVTNTWEIPDVSVTVAYILAFIRCLVDAGSRTLSGYGSINALRCS